jgi:Beta-lactamase
MRKSLLLLAGIGTLQLAVPRRLSLSTAALAGSGRPGQYRIRTGIFAGSESLRIAGIENGLLPAVTIRGQPAPTMTIADRMRHYNVPGVSVAFFDHGQILWTRTYGFADVAGRKPVTTETLLQAASISKPVSALAALRLVQEGKLTLDEDVNAKLHTWKVPENEFSKEQKVTLRRILSHSEVQGEGKLTVTLKGDELYVQLGPEPQQLLPEAENELFILSQNLVFSFQKDDKGVVTSVTVRGGSRLFEARKLHSVGQLEPHRSL